MYSIFKLYKCWHKRESHYFTNVMHQLLSYKLFPLFNVQSHERTHVAHIIIPWSLAEGTSGVHRISCTESPYIYNYCNHQHGICHICLSLHAFIITVICATGWGTASIGDKPLWCSAFMKIKTLLFKYNDSASDYPYLLLTCLARKLRIWRASGKWWSVHYTSVLWSGQIH